MFELDKLYKHENMRDVHFKVISCNTSEKGVSLLVHWYNEVHKYWIGFENIIIKNEDIKKYKNIKKPAETALTEEERGGYGEDMS
jgi:hypothetical protein